MKKLVAAVLLFLASLATAGDNVMQTPRPFVRSLLSAQGPYCGSVVVRPGAVLTAAHCIAAYASPALRDDGATGTLLAQGDERLDLALLVFARGEAECPCVPLAESEAEIDEQVYVVGYPGGIAQVMTFGHSQGVHDNARLPYGRRLVLTAQVMGGNSGGGVFVLRGNYHGQMEFQLVGILVEALDSLSFAVPLADIRPFLQGHS